MLRKIASRFGFPSEFWGWWLFAIVTRIVAAKTHTHWFHPDEWCQTMEPANLIAHGFGIYSQEIGLHLRNLTWASLLAGVLKFSTWMSPTSVDLKVFGVNLFCGLLDLFVLWGWICLMKKDRDVSRQSLTVKSAGLALLLLPWFTVYESVSPRAEHISEIATWAALGFLALESWLLAGLASVGVFAFRYPSGLISLGISVSVLIHVLRIRQSKPLIRYGAGLLLGAIGFGLADMVFYGRPWESFWMYLQYNVLTGASSLVFGKQDITVYKELFLWNWATYPLMIPLGILLAGFSCYGFFLGLKRKDPWAICVFFYLIGHLWTPHKEGRFVLPIEALLRWSAFVGICSLLPLLKQFFEKSFGWVAQIRFLARHRLWKISQVQLRGMALILIAAQGLIFLHHLRADFLKERGVYRQVGDFIQAPSTPSDSRTCGILTPIILTSILMPYQESGRSEAVFPSPAVGNFSWRSEKSSFASPAWNAAVTWMQHRPVCRPEDTVLFQVQQATGDLESAGCELLPSGAFAFIPSSAKEWALNNPKLHLSAWYRCPSVILDRIALQNVEEILSHDFGKFTSLPGPGTTAFELQTLGRQTSPPPKNWNFAPLIQIEPPRT